MNPMKQRAEPNQRRREKKPIISLRNKTYQGTASFLVSAFGPYSCPRVIASASLRPVSILVFNLYASASFPIRWSSHVRMASVPEIAAYMAFFLGGLPF